MESAPQLISSLASLAWPLVFAVLLYKLFEPIRSLVESARARKFTIKVAGNELSMDEASEQQRILLSDLQAKVAELERIAATPGPAAAFAEPSRSRKRILWVDDRPSNNSYLIATLEDRGASITNALSTSDALKKLAHESFDVVISDMARPEGEHAGLDLARKIKGSMPDLPVFIFCSRWAAENLQADALANGASGITSSATSLLSMLPLGQAN